MDITSNTDINAIYFGVSLSNYGEYSCIDKSKDIIEMTSKIQACDELDNVRRYFMNARQNTCEEYPFWPRLALLESATFFIKENSFEVEKYYDFVRCRPNLTDQERNESFFSWVNDFPKHLDEIRSNGLFQEINAQIGNIVNRLSENVVSKIDVLKDMLNTLSMDIVIDISTLSVIICPLKCVYSADYFTSGTKMSVILGEFLPHSIVHEYLHLIVHPLVLNHKDAIISQFGLRLYDVSKSYYLGNDENGFINAFEEHIVRMASNLLSNEKIICIEQLIKNELSNGSFV
jgi:hypothetical protein